MGVETESDCLGLTDFDFFAPEHAQAARQDELRVMRTGEAIVDLEEREVWPDGRITWVSTTKVPLYSRDGRVIGIFGLSRDITARKLAEQKAAEQAQQLEDLTRELEQLAIHDPLTGLYNRRGIDLMGGRAVARAVRDGSDACVLFIDVDGLKAINDGFGHAAGDRVLVGVAAVLRDAVRATDIVGRIGGDEFAAVLPGQSAAHAQELCARDGGRDGRPAVRTRVDLGQHRNRDAARRPGPVSRRADRRSRPRDVRRQAPARSPAAPPRGITRTAESIPRTA